MTRAERGLILVRGAVPGSKGGWVFVKDAVKKHLPDDAPQPGSFKSANSNTKAEAPAAKIADEPEAEEKGQE